MRLWSNTRAYSSGLFWHGRIAPAPSPSGRGRGVRAGLANNSLTWSALPKVLWGYRASSPAAAACTICERFCNTAPPHLNAWEMVLNGARRVSSWHATDNVHMSHLEKALQAPPAVRCRARCLRLSCVDTPVGEGSPRPLRGREAQRGVPRLVPSTPCERRKP